MRKHLSFLAVASLVGLAACGGGDQSGEAVTTDTSTAVVQQQDTLQTTTTTTVETDTQKVDSTNTDSTADTIQR